jgi:hypothetical protein
VSAAAIPVTEAAPPIGITGRLLCTFEYIAARGMQGIGACGDIRGDGSACSACSVEDDRENEGFENLHDDESDFANERLFEYL